MENETNQPNLSYDFFQAAHQEAALNYIPLKPKKRLRVPWETQIIKDQRIKIKESASPMLFSPTIRNMK